MSSKEEKYFDINKLKTVDSTWYSSENPHHFKQLEEIISKYVDLNRKHTLADLNAHVGGFSLRWALGYPLSSITSIEYDNKIFETFKENIKSLGIKNIKPLLGDSYMVITEDLKESKFDFVYMDPPWIGQHGEDYRKLKNIDLYYAKKNAVDLIQILIGNKISKFVFFKVPRNYNFSSLNKLVKIKYKTYNIKSQHVKKPVPDYLLIVLSDCSDCF